ncbi:MAG: hypothetical protein EOP90_13810 [Lysobacteraceae bacterium]|nr:MAG: hypothetical protein EOP90_13810 [Xanthomonadaceae bacterium]
MDVTLNAMIDRYLLHALESERGAVEVYATSLSTTPNSGWRRELTRFLDDARKHEQWMTCVCDQLGMDPEEPVAGRDLIAFQTLSMIEAIRDASRSGDALLVPLVASECIVLAETRNQLAWAPFTRIAANVRHECVQILSRFATDVRSEHAHHLARAMQRSRRLWRRRLGLDAPGRARIVQIPHTGPAANAGSDTAQMQDLAATAA